MTQSILATLIVLAAIIWLLRRFYLTIRAAAGGDAGKLGGCGSCSRNPTVQQAAVVKLGVRRSGSATKADTQ